MTAIFISLTLKGIHIPQPHEFSIYLLLYKTGTSNKNTTHIFAERVNHYERRRTFQLNLTLT